MTPRNRRSSQKLYVHFEGKILVFFSPGTLWVPGLGLVPFSFSTIDNLFSMRVMAPRNRTSSQKLYRPLQGERQLMICIHCNSNAGREVIGLLHFSFDIVVAFQRESLRKLRVVRGPTKSSIVAGYTFYSYE